MKKIFALLLAICCIFACVSCADEEEPVGPTPEDVKAISDIINSSKPTQISTNTEYVLGEEKFVGYYETQIDIAGGKSMFKYNYQRPASVQEMNPDGHVKPVKGVVYYQDGKVSVNEGEDWNAADSQYIELHISLDAIKLAEYAVSEDGKILTATFAAADAVRILGADISAEGTIRMIVTTNGQYLYNVRIEYTAASNGASVVVDTSYDYRATTLEFPGMTEAK
jgi:hypothetical protein